MNRVELKNVKEFSGLEGPCGFNCTVYIDGVRVGTAMNEGSGGCNFYEPHDLQKRLTKIAKEDYKFEDDFEVADQLIGRLLDRIAVEKSVKRTMKNKLLYISVKGGLYETGKLTPEKMAYALANPAKVLPQIKGVRLVTDLNEAVELMLAQS